RPQFVALRNALIAWIDELSLPSRDQLADGVKKTSEKIVPPSDERIEQAKTKLTRSVAELVKQLNAWGKVAAGWRTYLRLADLKDQLKPDAKPAPPLLGAIPVAF